MKNKLFSHAALTLGIFLTLPLPVRAQESVTIHREADMPGTEKPIPISLSGFSGEVRQVLEFDLEVQGFKVVADGTQQFDVTGSSDANNVTGRVADHVNKAPLLAKSYTSAPLRMQAHKFADDVVSALTNPKREGIGLTRIAFKVDTGANSEVYYADFDGHNAKPATADNAIVAAPCWSGRNGLFYASYMLGTLQIFEHNLSSGARTVFARGHGSNFTPAVSPDGSKVAFISNRDGWTDLYVCNRDGSNVKRLTKSPQDESSPCWSPDGRWILFAGKIDEHRALYKISATGEGLQRIKTAGVASPSEPDWSPDGKWIVFTAQMGGFELCVVPATGGEAIALTAGEDPSWSANSRTVIFARRSGNGRTLSVLDVFTKQVKDVARISGSNSQPSWAK